MPKSTGPSTRRRSAGEGSVYETPDGRWRGRITWTEPDGSQQRRYVRGRTSAEARDRLDELRNRLKVGTLAPTSTGTLGEYLAGWIERHRDQVRPSTWRTAELYVRVYLTPALGRIPLGRLTAADVERALASFVRSGRPIAAGDPRPPRPVSPVTAGHVRAILRAALGDAARAGLVGRNVAADAKPPHVPHRPIAYLSSEEVGRLLDVTADDPLGPLYAIAASTGLRRGELVALRWTDVDLAAGTLTVSRSIARNDAGGWSAAETKSARSRRTLPLGSMTRHAFERQRRRQAAAKLAAGSTWQDRAGLVFTDAVGRPVLPEHVSHAFDGARTRAGLPTATLHQLRHTAATMLLAEGIPLAVISEWLGHSGIGVTIAHYAAVVPALHRQAADALDRALGSRA
ncbi:MAG TPA: tyrosine-type recombinase/integrase [Candidatus Limnocylindrales bacterium]|jgi:integrase